MHIPTALWSVIAFPIYFVAIWVATFWLLARLSGWVQLADKYRCEPSFVVSWTGWQSGKIGTVSYKRCLWIAVATDGLYLKTGPAFLFGFFHPPVRIPWSAISNVEEGRFLWAQFFKIKLTDSNITITIWGPALREGQRYLGEKLKLLYKKTAN